MDPLISLHTVIASSDAVTFLMKYRSVEWICHISKNVLEELGTRDHQVKEHFMAIFEVQRELIADAALMHAVQSPDESVIVLGINDF